MTTTFSYAGDNKFTNATSDFDKKIYERFLSYLDREPKSHILDINYGSGADSNYFISIGYQVTAIDHTKKLACLESKHISQPALRNDYVAMDFIDEFDAIWASKSMRHIPQVKLQESIETYMRALKSGGVWYMSYSLGVGERLVDGVLYNDQNEIRLKSFIEQIENLNVIEIWSTKDLHEDRKAEFWIHCIAKKV